MEARFRHMAESNVLSVAPEVLERVVPGFPGWVDRAVRMGLPETSKLGLRYRQTVMGANKYRWASGLWLWVARPYWDPVLVDQYRSAEAGMVHPDNWADARAWGKGGTWDAVCRWHPGEVVYGWWEAVGSQHTEIRACSYTCVPVGNEIV